MCNENNLLAKNYVFSNLKTKKRVWHEKERIGSSQAKDGIDISVLYFDNLNF